MVLINKFEKEKIVERFPTVGIVRTVPQKSKRHRYYMEERRDAMNYLRRLRGEVTDKPRSNNKRNDWNNKNNRGVV